jgi:hypothetical protein
MSNYKVNGKTIILKKEDENGLYTHAQALEYSSKLGGGWRLPDSSELEEIRKQELKKGISQFLKLGLKFSDPTAIEGPYYSYICTNRRAEVLDPELSLTAFNFDDGVAYMSTEESECLLRLVREAKGFS